MTLSNTKKISPVLAQTQQVAYLVPFKDHLVLALFQDAKSLEPKSAAVVAPAIFKAVGYCETVENSFSTGSMVRFLHHDSSQSQENEQTQSKGVIDNTHQIRFHF